MTASPSLRSAPNLASTAAMASGTAPRCWAMVLAWATIWPSAAQIAAEKSITSLTISERAMRITVYAMSSAMASRPLLMTANVMGSICMRSTELEHDIADGIEMGASIRRYHNGGIEFLDDERTAAGSRRQRCPRHHLGDGGGTAADKMHVPLRRGGSSGRRRDRQLLEVEALRAEAAADHAQLHELDRTIVAVAVSLLVLLDKAAAQVVGIITVKVNGELARLAFVAQVRLPSEGHPILAETIGGQACGDFVGEFELGGAELGRAQLVEVAGERAQADMLELGCQHADRAEYTGQRRHDDASNAKVAGEVGGMNAAVAAKGNQCQVARIAAALDRHGANGPGHRRIGDGA